jgi:hypothetical protein
MPKLSRRMGTSPETWFRGPLNAGVISLADPINVATPVTIEPEMEFECRLPHQ